MALYKDSEYCSGDGSNLGMPAQRRVRFSKATGEALRTSTHCNERFSKSCAESVLVESIY